MRGWSLSVGSMKKALADIPDDYEIVLDCADVEDCEISEVHIDRQMPPALGHAGLIVLGGGQVITSEYDYHPRLDVWLDFKGGHWDDRIQEWEKPS